MILPPLVFPGYMDDRFLLDLSIGTLLMALVAEMADRSRSKLFSFRNCKNWGRC
jgi:hypothetical protein